MTDTIKLADLPDDALTAIAASPGALDEGTLLAVVDEFGLRARDKRAHAAGIRKHVADRPAILILAVSLT